MKVSPDWNRVSARPSPSRSARSSQTIRNSAWIAWQRRVPISLTASKKPFPPQETSRRKTPLKLGQRRRQVERRRKRQGRSKRLHRLIQLAAFLLLTRLALSDQTAHPSPPRN